ncbi:hypothetical protein HKK80_04235 [Halonotius sp. F2-221B]|uniref:DUF7504 family protein n=1 Tax=Halonotius sp. F2-221B TaxID=2731620 RepID=UPI00398B6923
MSTHSPPPVVESAADDDHQVSQSAQQPSQSAQQPVSADAAPVQTANRLWDDFDADSDTDSSEPETTDAAAAEASTSTDSPEPDRAFGDVLDTLSSFGQSTSPTQVLVLSPISGGATNDIFSQICTAEGTATQNVVFVTATRSTNDRLPMTRKFAEWVDGESTLIEVGQPHSDTGSTRDTNTLGRKTDTHKEIPNPQNLAKLGVVISHGISQIDNGYPTVLGFHTLSSMVQHLGTERVVPFLYTLCSQLNESGVMGYCHLDPTRHSDDDVATIKSIFDVAVRIQPDGSVDIE